MELQGMNTSHSADICNTAAFAGTKTRYTVSSDSLFIPQINGTQRTEPEASLAKFKRMKAAVLRPTPRKRLRTSPLTLRGLRLNPGKLVTVPCSDIRFILINFTYNDPKASYLCFQHKLSYNSQ